MVPTLPNGTIIPEPTDRVSSAGNQEVRTLGSSVDNQLATKADTDYVDEEIAAYRWFRGTLPSGSLATVSAPGVYILSSGNTYTDAPPGFGGTNSGILNVERSTSNWGSQTVKAYGSTQYVASRNATGIGAWPTIWDEDSRASRDAGLRHQLRVNSFKRRRGGVIGLGGMGAVGFRFDHYYQDFMEKILPLMRQHQIVGSMAMNGNGASGTGIGFAIDPTIWC